MMKKDNQSYKFCSCDIFLLLSRYHQP